MSLINVLRRHVKLSLFLFVTKIQTREDVSAYARHQSPFGAYSFSCFIRSHHHHHQYL